MADGHGGKRIPGPGKTSGRPKKVVNGKKVEIYIDEETDNGLKQVGTNRSEAIRELYKFWLQHHQQ